MQLSLRGWWCVWKRRPREVVRDVASHWIAVLRLAGPQCDWLIIQQRVFHRLPLPVLLQQIIERLDGQGVDGRIPLDCQHPERAPTRHAHPGQNLLEGFRIVPRGRARRLWLASHGSLAMLSSYSRPIEMAMTPFL